MTTLSVADIDVEEDINLSTPNTAILTDKTIDGTGVFDILMSAVKVHLAEEYDNDRIVGKEYSTVYLGALTAVMQQSIAFIATSQNADKITSEIGLVRQKTVTELAQTADTLPVGLGFNAGTAINGLVAEQVLAAKQQVLLSTAQVAQSEAEVDLLGQKIVTELAQTDTDITLAKTAGYGYNNTSVIESVAKAQKDKIEADVDLTHQKVVTEVATVNDVLPVTTYAKHTNTAVAGIIKTQKDKTESEITLLSQKSVSELAQTHNTIPASASKLQPAQYPVDGVIDKQKKLFTAQIDGFTRKAERDLAKVMVDAWSVDATQNAASANPTNHLADADLGAVIIKAKNGIGV